MQLSMASAVGRRNECLLLRPWQVEAISLLGTSQSLLDVFHAMSLNWTPYSLKLDMRPWLQHKSRIHPHSATCNRHIQINLYSLPPPSRQISIPTFQQGLHALQGQNGTLWSWNAGQTVFHRLRASCPAPSIHMDLDMSWPTDKWQPTFWFLSWIPLDTSHVPELVTSTNSSWICGLLPEVRARLCQQGRYSYYSEFVDSPKRVLAYMESAHEEHAKGSKKESWVRDIPVQYLWIISNSRWPHLYPNAYSSQDWLCCEYMNQISAFFDWRFQLVSSFMFQALIVSSVFLKLLHTTSALFSCGSVLFLCIHISFMWIT